MQVKKIADNFTVVMALCLAGAAPAFAQVFQQRLPQDEVIYFVLPDRFSNGDRSNDRGGLQGDRLKTGFDPTHKGFYHGGDLKGLTENLDYIKALGATAIWLGPVYRNKPVQGMPGQESAGYHGYWIIDFTDVDPHLGTRADLRALVQAAHARDMKIYLDIVTNHTADVIHYKECAQSPCVYRSVADYPYATRGGMRGERINIDFMGDDKTHQTWDNFAKLTRGEYAYTPVVSESEAAIKVPVWLNDPIYYHNRGDSNFRGESSTYGDFSGLDDLFTEHPRVVQGFIEIYGRWIDDFGIDGFRIDTAKHVNPEFWQVFVPAMQARAKAKGIANFHIFGEAYDPDPGMLARFTRVDGYPAVLDFAFQSAAAQTIAGNAGTEALARLFAMDALYAGGEVAATQLPTFLGNHDMGRFAYFVRKQRPQASQADIVKRVLLANALLFFARGVPVMYYGDEQGFTGDGGDQDARQDMFSSKVPSYNDDVLLGFKTGPAGDHFSTDSPLFKAFSGMARLRAQYPSLRRGALQVRSASDKPGLFAFSRLYQGEDILVALNTSERPVSAQVRVNPTTQAWQALVGNCAAHPTAPGSVKVALRPLEYVVCRARRGN